MADKPIAPLEGKIDFKRLADLYKNKDVNARFEQLGRFYKGSKRKRMYDELPDVPRPSMFLQDPLVIGSPKEAVLAKRILDLDPYAKGNIRDITFGPTRDTMREMEKSGLPLHMLESTTLMGATNMRPGKQQIGINPTSRIGEPDAGYDAADTLAHEVAHRGGAEETRADQAGEHLRGLFKYYWKTRE